MALSLARPLRPLSPVGGEHPGWRRQVFAPDYRQLLWDGRRWMLAALLVFVVGALVGYAISMAFPAQTLAKIVPLVAGIREISEKVMASGSPVQRALIIYVHNVVLVYLMLEGGLMAGLPSAAGLALNGGMVGVMFGLGARISDMGVSPGMMLLAIAPHGIFEIPAMCMGSAWGMRLGLRWLGPAAAGRRRRVLARSALEAGQVFVLVALLLLIAAFVEGNVTLALTRAVHG